ncbi:MAG: dihydropteroate synthase [Pseudomonadota bacterium]
MVRKSSPHQAMCRRPRLPEVEVMGVLNLTPDSFSDGGPLSTDQALAKALMLVDEGAQWIDLGAESTRPGAQAVSEREELDRLMPVLRRLAPLKQKQAFRISVDSMKPAVMAAALNEGADMLNDVNGFRSEGAWEIAVQAPRICLMHMQGQPASMQDAPEYPESKGGVVGMVRGFFERQLHCGVKHGLDLSKVVLDPGIGFGKLFEHNRALLRSLRLLSRYDFHPTPFPLLVGLSRKRFIGEITGKATADRDPGSIGGALAAASLGASIIRVHHVGATVDALRVYGCLMDNPTSQQGY